MLVAVALFAACDKNDADLLLEGKWNAHTGTGMDVNHPLDITFQGSNYIWHIGGYQPQKEEGTYTYKDNILTLTGKAFYTCEVDWSQDPQGGTPAETGAWVKAELVFPCHKYKVLSKEENVMSVECMVDDFMAEGTKFILTRGDAFPAESIIKGTWEGVSDSGKTYRISFDGKNFTRWELFQQYGRLVEGGEYTLFTACIKETGTWTYDKGDLKLSPSQKWNSYIIHCDQYATPLWYECSPVNASTYEAETWYEVGAGAELWESHWSLLKAGDEIYVEIKYTNMDYFIIKKK